MTSQDREFVKIGSIVGTHGLRGDLKLRPWRIELSDLLRLKRVYLQHRDEQRQVFSILRSSVHKTNLLLRLTDYESLTLVEPLVGSTVSVEVDSLPPLEDGRYRFHQLEGMQVVDAKRGSVGSLVDLFTTAAHETYVIDGADGEILIPAVPLFVIKVDVNNQIITVDLPDELMSLNR